jgi:protoheme ferro-lyase
MGQLNDHNNEEMDGVYTRPTLDLYLVNKYWNFLTSAPNIS